MKPGGRNANGTTPPTNTDLRVSNEPYAVTSQTPSIVLQKAVLLSMNFISEDFIEHNVLRRPENIALHLRNGHHHSNECNARSLTMKI